MGCGGLAVGALVVALFLKSCSFGGGAGKATGENEPQAKAQEHTSNPSRAAGRPPKTESDGGPSDEIIQTFGFFAGKKFQRGSTMISTGGPIPAGTSLFPVRADPDPYGGYYRCYLFRDEFGDWKLLRKEGERKEQIIKPMRKAE